jgi:hypothetical protein
MRMPEAKFESVPCSARPMTRPAAPIAATRGVMLKPRAPSATTNPTISTVRRVRFTAKLWSRLEVLGRRRTAAPTIPATIFAAIQATKRITTNFRMLSPIRTPPSGDAAHAVRYSVTAWGSNQSTLTPLVAAM